MPAWLTGGSFGRPADHGPRDPFTEKTHIRIENALCLILNQNLTWYEKLVVYWQKQYYFLNVGDFMNY